jgi:hypothetical protein
MKFSFFTSSIAVLAAFTTLVSAVPTSINARSSELSDGQVLDLSAQSNEIVDGRVLNESEIIDERGLEARGKSGIASSALGFIDTILKQVAQDNEVNSPPLVSFPLLMS